MQIHIVFRLFVLCIVYLFAAQHTAAFASAPGQAVYKLNQPVAYCLTDVSQCTPDNEIALKGAMPTDLRDLNGGKQGPVTLIYTLPPMPEADAQELSILVAPRFRDFCFQFDNRRGATQCAHHDLTRIAVEPGAERLFAQQTKGIDIRIFAPNILMGSREALELQRQSERDPIMGLAGWYILLALAALAQMLTRRNRWASFCVVLLSLSLLARTLVSNVFGFAGITLFGSDIDFRLELLSVICVCIFATEFYGVLIGQKLKTLRRTYHALLLVAAAYVLLSTSLQHVYYSIRAMQYMSLVGLFVIVPQVYYATQVLKPRERLVMLVGVSAIIVGGIADVYMALRGLPFFAGIGLVSYCFAFESLCQFVLIALRNDAAHQEGLLAQQQALQAQSEAIIAQTQAQAQQAQNEALQAQTQLNQAQLAQSEKMASLGQLVAGITHEISTPIGAIKSSGASITDALNDALAQLPPLLQSLDASSTSLLMQLIGQANAPKTPVSSREERAIVKATTEKIDAAGIEQARQKAVVLVNLNAHTALDTYLPLLLHPAAAQILETAGNVAIAISSAKNINLAVERVAKIVLALKSFSRFDQTAEKMPAQLSEGIETVLTIYQAQTKHGIEIVRNYQDLPDLDCLPDELIQVWTNLIHNALHAMNHQGTLTLTLRQEGHEAVVSVGDSGCGIPEEIRNKIFDVFFTTKPTGVGSGLGLDIVKKIIDKHQGRIDVQSEVGVGTTFSVYLPYPAKGINT